MVKYVLPIWFTHQIVQDEMSNISFYDTEDLANFFWLLFMIEYHLNITFHEDSQILSSLSSFQSTYAQWSRGQNKFSWGKNFFILKFTRDKKEYVLIKGLIQQEDTI